MQGRDDFDKILTVRERQVLELVIAGLSAKEIAQRLGIAPRTVECHIDHLRSKTQSRNRAQMVANAVRAGMRAGESRSLA